VIQSNQGKGMTCITNPKCDVQEDAPASRPRPMHFSVADRPQSGTTSLLLEHEVTVIGPTQDHI